MLTIAAMTVAIELLISVPAWAHHPIGGKLPVNFFEGIMSGLGHPVIGFDHLAFIIASGLIALRITGGISIPITFVVATGIGAVVHLVSIDLPIPEIIIAASVVLFGILLAIYGKEQKNHNYALMLEGLAALAGIFHGYAYGEGIFGAEPTPMVAYLIGFTIIQLVISLGTYLIASKAIKRIPAKYLTRFAGGAIASCGIVFLSSAVMG
ncbi:HupE/UreJ family protein [Pleurocapsa sp. PCC 7319]|uniref:HupE/UreJ family protein n=1 Tax=Pleurocapsa sp. PCC 7319 TaxID=118161 RepID=UPI00034B93D8|nr:HupE/UreJ family protein [Pleurocapsa sp. PCC 7319]